MRPQRDVAAWLIVFGAGLASHLAYVWEARLDPTFAHPILDAHTYDRLATDMAAGTSASHEVYPEPPLYPYALSLLYRVLGHSVLAARIAGAVIGAATCLVTYSLGRRVFGSRVGLLAGVLTALSGPLVFFDTQLLATGLVVLLNLATLRLALWAIDRPCVRRWIACGACAGLAALATPNILAVLVVGAVALGASALRSRPRRRSVIGAGLLLLGAAIVIAPVTIRNARVAGEFTLISANGGVNLYIGNNPHADETTAIRPGAEWIRLVTTPAAEAGCETPAQIDRYYLRRVAQYVRERPGSFARGLAIKALQLVNAREIPRSFDVYLHRESSPLLSALVWRADAFAFPFGLLAPLALLGAVAAWRTHRESRLLVAYIVLYGATIVLFFVSSRYRQPIVPVLTVLAVYGATAMLAAVRSRRMRFVAGGAVLVAAAALAVNRPITVPSDRVNFRAEMHHFVGLALQHKHQFDAAERNLRRAVELDPHYAEACASLAGLLLAEGRVGEASQMTDRALAADPQYTQAHFLLGMIATRQRDWDAAAKHFADAVRLTPTLLDARQSLAVALLSAGRAADAVAPLREVVRRAPDNANARRLLAHALVTTGDLDGAKAQADMLLAADPNDGHAYYVLGRIAAAQGRWDDALREYEAAREHGVNAVELTHDMEAARAAAKK